ncbi:MAG TPA: CDP-glucose 4,6-dehydratase [Acidobacteriaceae bacterium]|nr:CDP-glucose 4,6-dehydratase [Acidobacteriaceae bacterium]
MTEFWQGRRVFLTGHTGFKGSWLALWLQQLGAEVLGYALPPPDGPSLYHAAKVADGLTSVYGDLNDLAAIKNAMQRHQPEIVIHMAAQSLVRASYRDPILTYETNVLGTAKVLEAVRSCKSVHAVVIVTTDKCYENREWLWAYRENDALGGFDPYSNSKACAEMVVGAYRNSFFHPALYADHGVSIATARAGNVIGGGDWSSDRLIVDIMRSFSSGEILKIRSPLAIRPWQHVLDPLRGYLMLAQNLYTHGTQFSGAWNFGPQYTGAKTVEWIVEYLAQRWEASDPRNNAAPAPRWEIDRGDHPHEAQMLKLDWTKAALEMGWHPLLSISEALDMTLDWYRETMAGASAREKCLSQMEAHRLRLHPN